MDIVYNGNIDFIDELHNYVKEVLNFEDFKYTIEESKICDEDVQNVNDNISLLVNYKDVNIILERNTFYYYNKQVIKVELYSYEFHAECERTKLASDLGLGAPLLNMKYTQIKTVINVYFYILNMLMNVILKIYII